MINSVGKLVSWQAVIGIAFSCLYTIDVSAMMPEPTLTTTENIKHASSFDNTLCQIADARQNLEKEKNDFYKDFPEEEEPFSEEKFSPEITSILEETQDFNDPLEAFNRVIFNFNGILHILLLRPITTLYDTLVPPPMKRAIRNILNNLSEPVVFANDILQGEFGRAEQTIQRFLVNSTYGIAGIINRAEELNIASHSEDFGQTLAVWGVPEIFYLVLPLLGPSNPRDVAGRLFVDSYFDAFNYFFDAQNLEEWIQVRRGVNALDAYANASDELDKIRQTSLDYYTNIRSLYRQKRMAEIRNGASNILSTIPHFLYESDSEPIDINNSQ